MDVMAAAPKWSQIGFDRHLVAGCSISQVINPASSMLVDGTWSRLKRQSTYHIVSGETLTAKTNSRLVRCMSNQIYIDWLWESEIM